MENLNSQNASHTESPKQLFIKIFIPVVEHAHTLRHSMFLFYFSLLFIHHFIHIYGQTDFLQFAVNEVASMAALLVWKLCFWGVKKKKKPGYKESLFVLNHLIHIFNIYMHNIYILLIYIINIYISLFFARSVGTSYSA